MAIKLTEADQAALDASLGKAIGPASLTVGLGYLISAIAHRWVGGADSIEVAPWELATALPLIGYSIATRSRARSGPEIYWMSAILAAAIFLNNLSYVSVHREAQYLFVLSLTLVAFGFAAALPLRLYSTIVATGVAVHVVAVTRSWDPFLAWVEPTLTLTGAVALSVTLRTLTREFLTQTRRLHLQNERVLAARDAALSRYRELTEMTSDMIAELDADGRILYANPTHRNLFGVEPESLVGIEFASLLVPRRRDAAGLEISKMLRQPLGPLELEIDIEGEAAVVELTSRPYVTQAGDPRIVVTSRDVTTRALLEKERALYRSNLEDLVEDRTRALTQSVLELQRTERLATVGTLAAGIAHQINNPVGGILLSSQLALAIHDSGDRDTEHLTRALSVNVQEAQRCGEIVRNLLRFARNEPMEKEPVDLGVLLERVVDLCRPYAVSRGASLRLSIATGDVLVRASAVELEQAMINLIRNGIEAGPSGVHVDVGLRREAMFAFVEVVDDGLGIEPDQLIHIFDPFYTTRLGDGGTGLGLSVVHGIAEDHDGSLSVESEPGEGSRMHLELPILESL